MNRPEAAGPDTPARDPACPLVGPSFFFDRASLRSRALERRDDYPRARPFPHAVFDEFLGPALATALAGAFPPVEDPAWMRRDYPEQSARLGQLQRSGFASVAPPIRHLLNELCGMAFLEFLTTLTGQEGLIADPHFRGAGPSATLPGGHLALHADFNRDRGRHLRRRLTVLYYLCPDWDVSWGGALELWDHPPNRCVVTVPPLLDRLVVMDHGDTHWHGHPSPLSCPEGRFRAAIGAYYYVAEPSVDEGDAHGAIWAPGPVARRSGP